MYKLINLNYRFKHLRLKSLFAKCISYVLFSSVNLMIIKDYSVLVLISIKQRIWANVFNKQQS